MEVSIRMMIAVVLAVIFFLVLVMLITNMGGDASASIGSFFDWFKGMIGSGPNN